MSSTDATLPASSPAAANAAGQPGLLDVVREMARRHGHAPQAIGSLVYWVSGFVRFHGLRHPRELQLADVARFLEQVAREAQEPLTAIEAARTALEFLYQEVLHRDLGELPRAKPPRLLDQVRQVLRVRHYALATEACYV